jgi:predicted ATPase
LRNDEFRSLRDCAFDLTLFESLQGELVMQESLLRSVPVQNVRTRLHRLALGDATLTHFRFAFDLPSGEATREPLELTFKIEPFSNPPTNVHVLIGRNGVGKSRCMQIMARAIVKSDVPGEPNGVLRQIKEASTNPFFGEEPDWQFAGLIFVSFSAFDDFVLPDLKNASIRTAVVGLQKPKLAANSVAPAAKSREELNDDFLQSFAACRRGLRADRLRAAISTLGNDPLFADADIASHLGTDTPDWEPAARMLFDKLSSGHAIVLLTITRLVEFVDERTLVLLDEPEGHLHPPLLSAFIRSLADLLIQRNGVAIIATHSPVVLQEVPQSCVWKLRRTGTVSGAERPAIETFGENVGVLTREVFGLEVTNAGFHKLLKDAIQVDGLSYESVLARFGGQMGAEARAIARALVADRDANGAVGP